MQYVHCNDSANLWIPQKEFLSSSLIESFKTLVKIAELCKSTLESLLIKDAIWLRDSDAIAKASENEGKRREVTEMQWKERTLGSTQQMMP